jgi:hypothetical protein
VTRFALAIPVLPGKDARSVPKVWEGREAEYEESRARLGMRMERVYQHATPVGTFAVAYMEATGDYRETLHALATSDLPLDREFVAALSDAYGFELSRAATAEPPILLVEWFDPDVHVRKPGLGFALPLMPGKTNEGLWWREEAMNLRRDEFTASRRALGQNVEVVVLNSTPHGDVLCIYIEADDPVEAQRRFAESTSDFDVWFKQQMSTTTAGMDFNKPMPSVEQIWDWHRDGTD